MTVSHTSGKSTTCYSTMEPCNITLKLLQIEFYFKNEFWLNSVLSASFSINRERLLFENVMFHDHCFPFINVLYV